MAKKTNAGTVAVLNTARHSQLTKQPTRHDIPETIKRSELSAYTLDVLENFGLEAPALLNDYSCTVEDAFVETASKLKDAKEELAIMVESYELLRQEFDDYKKANA